MLNQKHSAAKKARVVLLNPPTAAVSTEIILGLAYLAAVLRAKGHEVKIIDATAPHRPLTPKDVEKIINEFHPNFIGVTLTITYIPQTYLYLKDLRKMGIPIVAGGPHANCLPEEVLQNNADIVAIGEGEETIVELAEYFLGERPLDSIAGLCLKGEDDKARYTAPRRLVKDLDNLPFPDFNDFPIKNYTGSEDVNSNPIFWSVSTSRGCAFDCLFCSSNKVFGRMVRARSARNVFEEIKSLVNKFGVENITFQDDEILCSKKKFLELLDLISDSGLKIKMSIRTRIDSIDEEILLKAAKAGLQRISFGIESWNDDTLKKINKRYTTKTIHERFKMIEASGFPRISFTNIVGFPWETPSHLRKHLKEISRIPKLIPYFSVVNTPIPYPKTKLYEMYHEQFGFTNWWLDTKRNSPVSSDGTDPFFAHFAIMKMRVMHIQKQNIYWHYSKNMKREIDRFVWRLFAMFMKRHFKFHNYIKIICLCRMSYLLWRISPGLERAVFRNLANSKILGLKKEIKFVSKG